jgi:cytochrome c peroxidase
MHDGSLVNLADVVDHYDRGGIKRPSLSDVMEPLHLTSIEKQDLLAFLGTLTGNNAPVVVPVLPNPQTGGR